MLATSIAYGAGATSAAAAVHAARVPILQGLPANPPLPTSVVEPMPRARSSERAPQRAASTFRPPAPAMDRVVLNWFAAALGAVAIGLAVYFVAATSRNETPRASALEKVVATAVPSVPVAAAQAPAEAEPPAPPAAQPTAPQAEETAATERPAAPPPRERSTRPARARNGDDGAKILFAADSAYRAGDPQRAYDLVKVHEKRYPTSDLTVERNALRAQLLCQLGKVQAARRVVLELEADHASDNVLDAVGQACTNL